jgi:hypothetical protein
MKKKAVAPKTLAKAKCDGFLEEVKAKELSDKAKDDSMERYGDELTKTIRRREKAIQFVYEPNSLHTTS